MGQMPTAPLELSKSNPSPADLSGHSPAGAGTGGPKGFHYTTGDRPLDGYTIKFAIDHGGFGEVYYAVSDAGKEVALKLLRRNLDVELRGVAQCLNLKHPHLLSIYDIRQDNKGDWWIIMEYVAGEKLADRLAASPGGLPVEEIVSWFQGIASGLAYLHDQGIVHRDLKPSNIFREQGIVKIGDYGLCKFISAGKRSGQTESVGTVHYMAPEIANGRYGKQVDIYALGVILYEMLTGRVPFDGESVGEILMKHMVAQPDLGPVLPEFRPIVARALDKDPEKRYQSVREMAAEVARVGDLLTSGSAQSHRLSPPPVPGRPPEEPTGHGSLKDLWQQLRLAWRRANLDTPTKFLLVAGALIFLFTTAYGWIPLLIVLAIAYGLLAVVRGVWHRALALFIPGWRKGEDRGLKPPPLPSTHRLLEQGPGSSGFGTQLQGGEGRPKAAGRFGVGLPPWARRGEEPGLSAAVSVRQEVESLLANLLKAVAITLVMNLVMLLPLGFRQQSVLPLEVATWLVTVSILSAWTVLATSTFCRCARLDAVLTRFLFMVVGLALGLTAFGLARFLELRLPLDPQFTELPAYQLPPSFYDAEGQPRAPAFLAVFGSLFLVLRWWRYTRPDRPSRLSVLTTALSGLVGWVVAALWAFPQPWPLIIACSTAVTVQLASPWKPTDQPIASPSRT
ncbi:MAG: serine/threonine protein kinase [Thermoguttaceae bacterium]|nr:serine/threonine protein kinase [Thermoguttaceae bacterium]